MYATIAVKQCVNYSMVFMALQRKSNVHGQNRKTPRNVYTTHSRNHNKQIKKNMIKKREYISINEEQLIKEVKSRPILYDKSLKGYHKLTLREQSWQEVSNILESTGTNNLFIISHV